MKTIYYHHLDVPDSDKITAFQKKVYGVTRLIPSGFVTTYGAIAKLIKCKSAQAVGQALRRNSWPIDLKNVDNGLMVPCHRVIGYNGTIGGFGGQRNGIQIERKIDLLKKEGVVFVHNDKTNKYELQNSEQITHLIIKRFRKTKFILNST